MPRRLEQVPACIEQRPPDFRLALGGIPRLRQSGGLEPRHRRAPSDPAGPGSPWPSSAAASIRVASGSPGGSRRVPRFGTGRTSGGDVGSSPGWRGGTSGVPSRASTFSSGETFKRDDDDGSVPPFPSPPREESSSTLLSLSLLTLLWYAPARRVPPLKPRRVPPAEARRVPPLKAARP